MSSRSRQNTSHLGSNGLSQEITRRYLSWSELWESVELQDQSSSFSTSGVSHDFTNRMHGDGPLMGVENPGIIWTILAFDLLILGIDAEVFSLIRRST